MSKDTSGPAFPCTEANGLNNGVPGMTLRQYYAGLAMQVLMANPNSLFKEDAIMAFAMADAMVEEGEQVMTTGTELSRDVIVGTEELGFNNFHPVRITPAHANFHAGVQAAEIERLKSEAELFAKHTGLTLAAKDTLLRQALEALEKTRAFHQQDWSSEEITPKLTRGTIAAIKQHLGEV